jgi:hypothetical protein
LISSVDIYAIKDAVPAEPKSLPPSASLVVVLNWREELKALMPTK